MAYQAIEDLDANKSNFVRMVTHELRSPVSVTRSLLRTITAGYAGEISPQQKDILERASRRAVGPNQEASRHVRGSSFYKDPIPVHGESLLFISQRRSMNGFWRRILSVEDSDRCLRS